MFVERHGRGPEVYFALHGWGGDRNTFAPLAPYVPTEARLYSADLPGCGDSPAPRVWSVEAVVDEIVEAVRQVELMRRTMESRVTLVGNCGGAVFALLAAEALGEKVGRVVMLDPFAYLPRYFRLFLAGDFGRRAYSATFANPFGRWVTNQTLRGRRAATADLTASFAETDHESARRYLALYDEVGVVERFRGFAAPVEIAHGDKTFGAVRRSLALWTDVLPRARVHTLEGAGHQPIAEAPAQAARVIFG
ncbi:MAG TPA: alpha/beta fold hydrolase [Pyrinomonadaceae bacterium]|nr:alpha/beta fold hydrolase [Pyrinomonadaceae bacterium]